MSFFVISPGTDHVSLDPRERTGTLVFSVQNKTGAHRRVRALVVPDDPDQGDWYTVREPVRNAGVDETIQFPVSVAVPADTPAGEYPFRLRAVAEDDPDDVYRDSQNIRVSVAEAPSPPFPWWIVAIVVAVLVVVAVLIVLLAGNGDPPPPDEEEAFAFGIQRGQTLPLSGTTSAADPRLAGTVQTDTLRNYFVASGGSVLVTGELQDRVVRSDDAGTMIYAPRIRQVADVGSGAVVTGLVLSGFADTAVEAEFRTDGLGDAGPTNVSRSSDGDELRFDFSTSPLATGQASLFLSLFTDGSSFTETGTIRIVARTAEGDEVTSAAIPLHAPGPP